MVPFTPFADARPTPSSRGRARPGLTVGKRIALLIAVPLIGLIGIFGLFTATDRQVASQLALSRSELRTALAVKSFRDQIVATQLGIAAFLLGPDEAARAALIAAQHAANQSIEALGTVQGTALPASLSKGIRTVSLDVDTVVKAQDALGSSGKAGLVEAVTSAMDALSTILNEETDYSDP